MRLRTFPAVLRIHNSKRKVDHEQHYSEMLLFSHWRDEAKEFHETSPNACIAEHDKRKNEINENRMKIYPGDTTIELFDITDLELRKPKHISDTLDCQGEQDNDDDQVAGPLDDPEFESFGYLGNLNMESEDSGGNFQDYKYKKIQLPSTSELNYMTRKLVPEQMNVLRKVVSSCKSIVKAKNNINVKPAPVRLIVHGGAGVGKSATIKAVSTQAEHILRNASAGDDPNCPKVLICAFTAKAANIVGGITFHSALSLKIGNKVCFMSDKTRAQIKHNLANLKLLIIDEVSLVGADMLYRIHMRLCTILEMDEKLDPFANINVMLVGDLMQLSPVMGHLVFSSPKTNELKGLHDGLGEKSLWKQFQPMILKHNHRQGDEKQWAEALNEFRIGIVTEQNEALLRSRIIGKEILEENAMHVFYYNKDVTAQNDKMLERLPGDLISVKALQSLPKGRKPIINKKRKTVGDTDFMETLEFKIGARVMIVKNIDLMDDIFNGAGGRVIGVEYKGAEVHCIIVKFDNDNWGQSRRERYKNYADKYKEQNGTPIFREEHEYQLKSRNGLWAQAARAKLVQFPLRLNYASTAHKIQVSL